MIKDYTLKLSTRAVAIKKIDEIVSGNPNQDYTLTVVEKSEKRSLSANRAYQAWIPAISDVFRLNYP